MAPAFDVWYFQGHTYNTMELHTITISNFNIEPVIGVYDVERSKRQTLVLNLTIEHTRPSLDDDIETTFDYDAVAMMIEKYAEEKQPYLIETFAHAIADLCLQYREVQRVEVEVQKPAALKNAVVATVVRKSK